MSTAADEGRGPRLVGRWFDSEGWEDCGGAWGRQWDRQDVFIGLIAGQRARDAWEVWKVAERTSVPSLCALF